MARQGSSTRGPLLFGGQPITEACSSIAEHGGRAQVGRRRGSSLFQVSDSHVLEVVCPRDEDAFLAAISFRDGVMRQICLRCCAPMPRKARRPRQETSLRFPELGLLSAGGSPDFKSPASGWPVWFLWPVEGTAPRGAKLGPRPGPGRSGMDDHDQGIESRTWTHLRVPTSFAETETETR